MKWLNGPSWCFRWQLWLDRPARQHAPADPSRLPLPPIGCLVSVALMFGENLARQREAAGLSQEEVGLRAEVHRTEVSQLERGLRCPRMDTLVKLAGDAGRRAFGAAGGHRMDACDRAARTLRATRS